MKDRKLFSNYMSLMAEVFDKEISKPLSSIYWRILEPYGDAQCEAAFKAVIGGRKFFPKPAELLELIEGTPEDRALEALEKVLWAVRRIGPYASVKFDDPKIHGAIESMGGWVEFQDCSLEEWKWRQKDFLRHYAIQNEKNQAESLPGLVEMENRNRGFSEELPEPVAVGRIKGVEVGFLDVPNKGMDLRIVSGTAGK